MRSPIYRPVDQRPPARPQRHSLGGRLALGAGLAALVAVPFVLLLVLVEAKWEPLERLDRSTADDLNSFGRSQSWFVNSLDTVEVVFDPWVFRLVVLGVALWLWHRSAHRLATWAVVTMAVGGVLGAVLKLLVERARPVFPEPIAHSAGYSFPSGHALNSMLGVAVLILIFLPVLHTPGRVLAYLAGGVVVLLTGFDRVALGVHFVSDVVAGWVIALAVVAGTSGAFEIWRREQGRRPSTVSEGVEPEAAPEISEDPT